MEPHKTITYEDIDRWHPYALDYLVDILTGDYSLEAAREDVLSLRNWKPGIRNQ